MEKLPPELLAKIMLYLPPIDRLTCSLTCRRFAEAMTDSQLLHDIWLDIDRHEMEAATSVLRHSQREYTKLLLYRADLFEFASEFWGNIGANLRVLELAECTWPSGVFYAILKQCTKLESLKIVDGFGKISIVNLAPPESVFDERLPHSLPHLRHLHLDIQLTAEILDLLLEMMPNVTSISLSPKFGREPDYLNRLPSILMRKNPIIRTSVHLQEKETTHRTASEFFVLTSGSLDELTVFYTDISERTFDAISNCTKLRSLRLVDFCTLFRARHLEKLVSNSPDLEILELRETMHFEDEDLRHLFNLRKLHTLSLSWYSGNTTEFLCSLGNISSLVKLNLRGANVNSRVIQSLGRLRNLRALILRECVDSECFEAICSNLKNLTELDLGKVDNLTDADGSQLHRFEGLQSLSFKAGLRFTDLTFKRGIGSRNMECLSIDGCSLTDAGLLSIAYHHDRLKKLFLSDCEQITDIGIVNLLRKESRLKTLFFRHCSAARCEWRSKLRDLCPRIRRQGIF